MRAQKLEALDQLAGGIAHDFNNILSIIIGNIDLYRYQFGVEDAQGEIMVAIAGAAERASELTGKLLSFSGRTTAKIVTAHVNQIIEDAYKSLRGSISQSISFDLNLQDEVWKTKLDPSNLQDAIINLTINASDSIKETGAITISTSNSKVASDYPDCLAIPYCISGDFVTVAIQDDGCGLTGNRENPNFRTLLFDQGFEKRGPWISHGFTVCYAFWRLHNDKFNCQRRNESNPVFP